MSDSSKQDLNDTLKTLTTAPPGTALSKWQKIVRVIAISIPVLGAIPTAYTLWQSYVNGVDYDQVAYSNQQRELWVNNIDCLPKFAPFNTGQGTEVGVAACPRTGDIAIRIQMPDGKSTQEWVSFADLKKKTQQTAALSGWLISTALAAPVGKSPQTRSGHIRLAQAKVEVKCQALTDKKMIVRIISDGGKCYREMVSPFRGTVEKREEVPCDTTCTPTG